MLDGVEEGAEFFMGTPWVGVKRRPGIFMASDASEYPREDDQPASSFSMSAMGEQWASLSRDRTLSNGR
jgi:hypothetical protein